MKNKVNLIGLANNQYMLFLYLKISLLINKQFNLIFKNRKIQIAKFNAILLRKDNLVQNQIVRALVINKTLHIKIGQLKYANR